MKCKHADRVENQLIFKLPVYLKKGPALGQSTRIVAMPDYYVERTFCIECLTHAIDRIYNRRWWQFWI